jgi:hypothetical protein
MTNYFTFLRQIDDQTEALSLRCNENPISLAEGYKRRP